MSATAATADRMLSPPEIARRLGVGTHKILRLIHAGQLVASDLSLTPGGRPRYRVAPADLTEFLRRRQVQVKGFRKSRPRKTTGAVPEYV